VHEPPDVLIAPRLGWLSALQYSRAVEAAAIGERDAGLVLDAHLGRGRANAA
jgi:hypothetical protein